MRKWQKDKEVKTERKAGQNFRHKRNYAVILLSVLSQLILVTILYSYSQDRTTKAYAQQQRENNITDEMTTGGKIPGMIFVEGGCYEMGCGDWVRDCDNQAKSAHEVCVDDFYIDQYEVTREKFHKVMWNEFINDKKGDVPAAVTWTEAYEFCDKVGKRLPTEAEWEYAARSKGIEEQYAGTNNDSSLKDYAWYSQNSGRELHPVGQKKPNRLGLYDMSGNIEEWCFDRYCSDYYRESPKKNPKGPHNGIFRVLRGGSFADIPRNVQVTSRNGEFLYPTIRSNSSGFRCAKSF